MFFLTGLLLALPSVQSAPPVAQQSLVDARRGFVTKLTTEKRDADAMPEPPAELFTLVQYAGPLGPMAAYLGARPGKDEKAKHAAILWITGGFPAGGAGELAWGPTEATNEQSARAYRNAGLVMMYPALRGTSGNPGSQETFFGEVDDVRAALAYLRKVPYVDPERIWLGGHSTGGTLALLVAECGENVRGVIALGPIDSPSNYGADALTYDPAIEMEDKLRSPIHFFDGIKVPTFVVEGAEGNAGPLDRLKKACKNPLVQFTLVDGADHFEVIASTNETFASRIAKLDAKSTLAVTSAEIQTAYEAAQASRREAQDLETLAAIRRDGIDLSVARVVQHDLVSRDRKSLEAAVDAVKKAGFDVAPIEELKDRKGKPYFLLGARKKLVLSDLAAVFQASRELELLRRRFAFSHNGWFAP